MTDADAIWAVKLADRVAKNSTWNRDDALEFAGDGLLRLVRREAKYDTKRCLNWRTWATTQIVQGVSDGLRCRYYIGVKHDLLPPRFVKLRHNVVYSIYTSTEKDKDNLEATWAAVNEACRDETDRRIVEMRADGMIGREIGAVIGMSEWGVSVRVSKIRRRFEKGGVA